MYIYKMPLKLIVYRQKHNFISLCYSRERGCVFLKATFQGIKGNNSNISYNQAGLHVNTIGSDPTRQEDNLVRETQQNNGSFHFTWLIIFFFHSMYVTSLLQIPGQGLCWFNQ